MYNKNFPIHLCKNCFQCVCVCEFEFKHTYQCKQTTWWLPLLIICILIPSSMYISQRSFSLSLSALWLFSVCEKYYVYVFRSACLFLFYQTSATASTNKNNNNNDDDALLLISSDNYWEQSLPFRDASLGSERKTFFIKHKHQRETEKQRNQQQQTLFD